MSDRTPPDAVDDWTERRLNAVARLGCDIPAVGQPVTIRHVNLRGVTIESHVPLRVGSVHQCRFRIDGDVVSLSARVVDSRYRPRSTAHTIGLEFRRLERRDDAAAERLMHRVLAPRVSATPAFA